MEWQVINPEQLGAPRGWNNGMLAPAGGRLLFIAGQIASDSEMRIVAEDFVGQFSRALQNVLSIVSQAGGQADNIGRLTIFITDMAGYLGNLQALGRAYRELMGRHYPAMALVEVSRLVHPQAMVEIEGLAVLA